MTHFASAAVLPAPAVRAGIALLALFVLLCLPGPARAQNKGATQGWSVNLAPIPFQPPYTIVVHKDLQELAVMDGARAENPVKRYVGTTGRVAGDKIRRGDLKTPEGVYFVVRHIPSGLDFFKYGNEAFPLNYPNPVDVLRKKTGSGIWIHGRGEPLVPLQTEGCVSMINDELAVLRPILSPGTPVLMAQTVRFPGSEDSLQAAAAKSLETKTRAWAQAWKAKSSDFYAFYDQKAYAAAQNEKFSAFKSRNNALFNAKAALDIRLDQIRILPGPGYWVTWFFEENSSSGKKHSGVRRLYWMQDDKGEFRIVGMEWLPKLKKHDTPLVVAPSPPLTWDAVAPGLLLDGSNKPASEKK
ncbi:L,D-transpeptidase family protein [Desulfovibrio sp. OttesenSCG-928-A18]|nr:L,D-transpeptidase family protein [Desulfovibrio sp. OttesenSCG-928-A18]